MKQMKVIVLSILFLFILTPAVSAAPADKQFIDVTMKAEQVQMSMTEGTYTKQEVYQEMSPYFTPAFIDLFLKETMMPAGNGEYMMMGTDFPMHFIPYFTYKGMNLQQTAPDQYALYEHFEAVAEGPVTYEKHHEAVIFENTEEGYKIGSVDYEYRVKEAKAPAEENTSTEESAVKEAQVLTERLGKKSKQAVQGANILQFHMFLGQMWKTIFN